MSIIMKVIRNIAYVKYRCPRQVLTSSVLPEQYRNFNNSPKLCVKMFRESENEHAYKIMKNNGYAINIETTKEICRLSKEEFEMLLNKDWSVVPPAQLFDLFPKFASYASENNLCITNAIFDNYIDYFTDNVGRATDEQLATMFYSVCQWPETESVRSRNFIEVWAALDDTCLQRLNKWSVDELLTFIALFFMINVTKGSEFFLKAMNKLATKAKKLTPNQLVQVLFFVGVLRKQPFDMHNLQVLLENYIDEYSVDELAIMSMGFFKSKTPIRNVEILKKICKVIIKNSKEVNEVSLAALLKVLRYSLKIPDPEIMELFYEMLNVLKDEVPRLSIMCNVHIALLGCSKFVFHKECMDSIADVVYKNISKTRLKDLERLILTYGTFNYTPQTKDFFFKIVIDELEKPERDTELRQHGRSFACCLAYFSLIGIYPKNLIKRALSEEFLLQAYGKQPYNYGKEILILHNVVEIFYKDEQINRLSDKHCKILSKKYTDYMPSSSYQKNYNVTEKMILDVTGIISEILGGGEFIRGDHILTHHQRGDLILCKSPEGVHIPVPEEYFSTQTFGLIRKKPDLNKWIVLIIVGRNGNIYGTEKVTGQFQCKVRELQHLGYHTNFIMWSVYSNLITKEEKAKYLNEVIDKAL